MVGPNVHEITGLRPDGEECSCADSVDCPDIGEIQHAVSKSELIEPLGFNNPFIVSDKNIFELAICNSSPNRIASSVHEKSVTYTNYDKIK